MPGEKAKDFKGTIRKLVGYMGKYKYGLFAVIVFAIGSTVFNIVGPKVLSRATTELFNGLMAKLYQTGGIDFGKIGRILTVLLGLNFGMAIPTKVPTNNRITPTATMIIHPIPVFV